MRQKTRGIMHKGNHGYALTSKASVREILSHILIGKEDCFIDIGCGKGGVLRYAHDYPFRRIAGIEIEDSLYEIAKRNFQKLNLTDIELYHKDAITFDKYNEFNVFFLFNPFDTDIYVRVLDKIFDCIRKGSIKQKNIYLLCFGRSEPKYIEGSGLFIQEANFTDKDRGTSVAIWKAKGNV